jgi:hypothetical protein
MFRSSEAWTKTASGWDKLNFMQGSIMTCGLALEMMYCEIRMTTSFYLPRETSYIA